MTTSVPNPSWGDDSSDHLGYDGAGRMITKRFLAGGIDSETGAYSDPTSILGFTTNFDKASNKLYERHLHSESRSHLYQPFTSGHPQGGYDSVDRLRQYQRGVLSSTGGFGNAGGGSVTTPITLPNAKTQQNYQLDGLGNWKNTAFTPVDDSQIIQRRDHNHLNQITATKDDSDPKTQFGYDGLAGASNGNLKNDGERGYLYDAFNRLVQVIKDPDGTPATVGTYTYDAMGRRIRKVITNGGITGTIPNGTTDFAYSGWRCVEERNPLGGGGSTDTPVKQMIWGIYLDELIQQKNLTAINNFAADDILYPLQDLLYRTTGLSDDSGIIREAYDCDAYGNTLIFRNAGTPPAAITFTDSDTQVDYPTCEFIFTGQRWDAESGIYYYKARFYVPELGRFGQKDPLGYVGQMSLYVSSRRSILSETDPFGLVPVLIETGIAAGTYYVSGATAAPVITTTLASSAPATFTFAATVTELAGAGGGGTALVAGGGATGMTAGGMLAAGTAITATAAVFFAIGYFTSTATGLDDTIGGWISGGGDGSHPANPLLEYMKNIERQKAQQKAQQMEQFNRQLQLTDHLFLQHCTNKNDGDSEEGGKCKPCIPPVGTIGYRLDKVPPSDTHWPFTGDHVHLYEVQQSPYPACVCFWPKHRNRSIRVIAPPPPAGAVPHGVVQGGGPA